MLINLLIISTIGYTIVDLYLKLQVIKLSPVDNYIVGTSILILLILEQGLVNHIINARVVKIIEQRDSKGNKGGISIDKVVESVQRLKETNPDSIVQDVIIDSKNKQILYRLATIKEEK